MIEHPLLAFLSPLPPFSSLFSCALLYLYTGDRVVRYGVPVGWDQVIEPLGSRKLNEKPSSTANLMPIHTFCEVGGGGIWLVSILGSSDPLE